MKAKELVAHLINLPDDSEVRIVNLDINEASSTFGEANSEGVFDFSVDGNFLTFSNFNQK